MQKEYLFNNINPFSSLDTIFPSFITSVSSDIDCSYKYPLALTPKGNQYLTNPLFWILYIRLKILLADKKKKVETLLRNINHACHYDIENRHILYKYFCMMIDAFVDKESVIDYITRVKQIKVITELKKEDYMLLLNDTEYFKKENYKKTAYNDHKQENIKEDKAGQLRRELIKFINENNTIEHVNDFCLYNTPSKIECGFKIDDKHHISFLSKKRRRTIKI